MAFPSNPTNGQKANVNGVVYTYDSTLTAWTVTSNFSGNVTVDQINANAVVVVNNTGTTTLVASTVTANTLSNVATVSNGTSNVSIASNGNITTAIGGNNITVVSTAGLQSQFINSPRTISANTTVGANTNSMSAGPITIADGVTVTVASGGEWSIV